MNPFVTTSVQKACVLLAGLVAAGTIGAGTAKADPVHASCLTIAAHASLMFGANTPSVEAVSNGASYLTYPCYRFVTDIVVPTNSSGGHEFRDAFRLEWGYAPSGNGPVWNVPLSQSNCALYEADFDLYKKTFLGGSFAYVGGGSVHGSWVTNMWTGSYCATVKDPGWVAIPNSFDPPNWFTTTYRLVVGAKLEGTWSQVKAGAEHLPFVP
jgi:hypothetical protein